MFYGAGGSIFHKARMLRGSQTAAEKLLWMYLKENKLNGFRFKRQHPISSFVADFYCHQLKLVIEIDEDYHQSEVQKIQDANRDAVMIELGLKILRFSDQEVLHHIDEVLSRVKKEFPS
jgi:very-short-patch-repair endonuclease